jgi:putative FmdB family regulatory protein
MPEYSFRCDKCDEIFERFFHVTEYESELKKSKCPSCKSKKIHRDFLADNVTPNYIKGVHEATTLGELADKRCKKLGKRTVEGMREDFKTKKRNTLEDKLPEGMTMSGYENSAKLSKKEIDKKRKSK